MIIDILFSIYCVSGAVKGRRRKLPDMLYRFTRNSTATLSGISFFGWTGEFLSLFLPNFLAKSLGFVLTFILSFLFVRAFKKWLTEFIESRLKQAEQSKWGAVIGFGSNFTMGSAGIIAACLSDTGLLHRVISNESFVGRTFTIVLKTADLFLESHS